MNLMHLAFIAACVVLGPGSEVSGSPLVTPSTATTIGGGGKKVAHLASDYGGSLHGAFKLSIMKRVEKSIQYQTQDPDRRIEQYFDNIRGTSTGEILDDPSDSILTLKDCQEIGETITDIYAGAIDQFVFLHILTKEERDEFIVKHSATAIAVFNGIPIADDELNTWKSRPDAPSPREVMPNRMLHAPPRLEVDVSDIGIRQNRRWSW